MNRFLNLLLGPEVFWGLAWAASGALARFNTPPTDAGNAWLERGGSWLLAALSLPLCFAVVFGLGEAPGSRVWPWIRFSVVTLLGYNLCLAALVGAIDYQDTRNAGVLGVWIYGIFSGLVVFVACAIALRLLPRP